MSNVASIAFCCWLTSTIPHRTSRTSRLSSCKCGAGWRATMLSRQLPCRRASWSACEVCCARPLWSPPPSCIRAPRRRRRRRARCRRRRRARCRRRRRLLTPVSARVPATPLQRHWPPAAHQDARRSVVVSGCGRRIGDYDAWDALQRCQEGTQRRCNRCELKLPATPAAGAHRHCCGRWSDGYTQFCCGSTLALDFSWTACTAWQMRRQVAVVLARVAASMWDLRSLN